MEKGHARGRAIGGWLVRLGAAACVVATLAAPAAAAEVMVHVSHGKLDPAAVEIAKGDTVVFHNLDAMPGGHTVVADDGSFSSPPLAKDAHWKKTFETSGSFGVHVKEHPSAKGVIRVR
jgi:plastocyanin